ncbi:MAG TPA: hypothetical protein PLG79_07730 [Spirochaetales bacterium]|nr:hypothetical protein [Spirochaetales bacterium]
MRVAFLHYHAKRGGVTRVVEQQMEALRDVAQSLFITGNGTNPETRVKPLIVPGAGYDGMRPEIPPEEIAEEILRAIESRWPSGCDILHVHNPLLRKNRDFLKILKILQKKGVTLFLQIHDTAEDLRPESYYFHEEYPENCHYGVINSRDFQLFLQAGLQPIGLHSLPNCVEPLPQVSSEKGGKNRDLVLYAVRAIRRKNVGETILLSCFLSSPYRIGITLPPTSPGDYPSYENWKSFVLKHNFPVEFELGMKYQLETLVDRSCFMITTSIREGFGFAFLEPWTVEKALFGRKIPYLAEDFERRGVDLSDLYEQLRIPLDVLPLADVRGQWETVVRETYGRYKLALEDEELENAWNTLIEGECIDFPYLHPFIAQGMIHRCKEDSSVKKLLLELNPYLENLASPDPDPEKIEKNRETVLRMYSKEKYRDQLLSIYQQVLTVPVKQKIHKKRLLRSFLNPKAFYLGGM